MTTYRDNSQFSGLPPSLVSTLIERGNTIGGQLAESIRALIGARDDLRARIAGQPGIAALSSSDTEADISTWGLSAAYRTVGLAAGDLHCATAFAAPGIGTEGEPRWRCETMVEKTVDGTAGVLPALASVLALELAGETGSGVVLADDPLTAIAARVLEGVTHAVPVRDTVTGKAYLTRLNASIQSLKGIFTGDGNRVPIVGVLTGSGGRELSSTIDGASGAGDILLGTVILDPGEYTLPVPVGGTDLDRAARLPIKDANFAGLRDAIVTAARRTTFVLFRPPPWTSAYRVELPAVVAGDDKRLKEVLGAVSAESATQGARRPHPLTSATDIAGRLDTAAAALGNSITTRMLGEGTPGRSDLSTFILTN